MRAKDSVLKIIVEICRLLLGATFVFSGFVKAVDPMGTTYKIQDYITAFGFNSLFFLALPLAILLSVAEFTTGAFMLLGIYRKWNSRFMLLIMLFMTPLTLYLAIANPVADCGCFGDAFIITNWQTFYKNLILLAAVIVTVIWPEKIYHFYTGKFYWVVGLLVLGFGICFALYNYYTEPVFDFRPYKAGANLPQLMSVEEGKGDVYENVFIYKKDGVEKEFTEENYPWQDTTWVFVNRINKLIKEGEKPLIHDFEINRLYFSPDKTSFEGEEDITREVLEDSTYVFLMLSYSLNEMDDTNLSKFVDIKNYADEYKYNFYCLTASNENEIIKWENENANSFKFCLTDERTIKTIMRSNPGLMVMKNGIIINKFTGYDLPSEEDLSGTMEQLPFGQPVDTGARDKQNLIIIIFVFFTPLLVVKILDFLIYRRKKVQPQKEENTTVDEVNN